MDVLARLDLTLDTIERHPPFEGMQRTIDVIYQDLKKLFDLGGLSRPDFVEFRSRLWSTRERVCELLLPESVRERPTW